MTKRTKNRKSAASFSPLAAYDDANGHNFQNRANLAIEEFLFLLSRQSTDRSPFSSTKPTTTKLCKYHSSSPNGTYAIFPVLVLLVTLRLFLLLLVYHVMRFHLSSFRPLLTTNREQQQQQQQQKSWCSCQSPVTFRYLLICVPKAFSFVVVLVVVEAYSNRAEKSTKSLQMIGPAAVHTWAIKCRKKYRSKARSNQQTTDDLERRQSNGQESWTVVICGERVLLGAELSRWTSLNNLGF